MSALLPKTLRVLAVCALAGSVSAGAHSQSESTGWQAELDLVTAGAAASIVLHYVCAGSRAAEVAADWAVVRLNNEAARHASQAPLEEVRAYAFSAADLKVKAMAQSTSGQACSQLRRLRDIALGTGFPQP